MLPKIAFPQWIVAARYKGKNRSLKNDLFLLEIDYFWLKFDRFCLDLDYLWLKFDYFGRNLTIFGWNLIYFG